MDLILAPSEAIGKASGRTLPTPSAGRRLLLEFILPRVFVGVYAPTALARGAQVVEEDVEFCGELVVQVGGVGPLDRLADLLVQDLAAAQLARVQPGDAPGIIQRPPHGIDQRLVGQGMREEDFHGHPRITL